MVAQAEAAPAAPVPLHGRSSILALIAGALDGVERGEGKLILVSGPTGMGKSAVLDAAVHRARGRGFRVSEARAVARDTAVPYDLLRELLVPSPGPAAPGPTDARAGLPLWFTPGDSGSLVSGFPSVAVLPEGGGPIDKRLLQLFEFEHSLLEIGRRLLYDQLEHLLLGDGATTPGLLAVDDLHHADRESLDFLRYLAGRLAQRRFVIIATLDPDTVPSGGRGSILDGLRHGPSVESVGLSALSLDETAEVIREVRPGPAPSAEYIRAIHERSKGVPGAIEQWKRRYQDALPSSAGGNAEPASADALVFQAGSVPEETLRILTYGAVIGRQFDLAVLARTLHRRSTEVLEPLLAPLVDNGTLRRRGRQGYEFADPAVRQDLYAKLTEARRRLMHRNVARALEISARSNGPELFEIAWHYHLAGEAVPSVDFNRRAADIAVRLYAYEEARAYLERALDSLWKLPSSRPESERVVRISLGHVLCRLGKIAEATQVLDALRDPALTGSQAPSPFEQLFSPEIRPDLWAHAESARAVAERSLRAFQTKSEARWLAVAHRALGVAAWSLADPSAAEEHHRAAAELAHVAGDSRLEGQSLLDRAHLVRLLDPNGLVLSRQLLSEAIERFAASGDAEWRAKSYLDRSAVLRSLGRLSDALSDLSAAAEQAERSGSKALEIWVELRTGRILVEEGRTGRARKTLEHLRQLAGETPRREVDQQITFITAMLQEREGRVDRARELYEKSLALAVEAGSGEEAAECHRRLAGLEERLGRVEEARRHQDEAERLSAAGLPEPTVRSE